MRGGRGIRWRAVQALALLHPAIRVPGLLAKRAGGVGLAAGTVGGALGQAVAGPVLLLTAAPPLLEILRPDLARSLARSLTFYRHVSVIFLGYMRTALVETKGLEGAAAQAVWDARHEEGAEAVVQLLRELSGFYLKVGQVFATKQDLFPPQYVRKLSFLYDACPPAPVDEVIQTIEQSLGKPLLELFEYFDYEPLATATVAQVHRARMTPTGREVVVKVQRQGMEKLMRQDMGNMLFFAHFMHRLGFDLKIDQVSILREYQEQVPLEFDFKRESRMLDAVGCSIRRDLANASVVVPEFMPELSSEKVLTMSFMEGPSLNQVVKLMEIGASDPLNRRRSTMELAGVLEPGDMTRDEHKEKFAQLERLKFNPQALLFNIIRCYGQQIFIDGVFHSDPHPGNILVLPKQKIGLVDFGECKQLSNAVRLTFARLTVALAHRDPETALPILGEVGVQLDNVPEEFRMAGAYLMFDTRMDIPEAHFSPLDPDAPEEFRNVSMGKFPQEYFMLLRVTALLRGLLAVFGEDLSASQIWEKYAQAALKAAGMPAPHKPLPPGAGALKRGRKAGGRVVGGSATSKKNTNITSIYTRMSVLAEWLQSFDMPHDRRALTPLATSGLTTIQAINQAFEEKDADLIRVGLARFTPEQRVRIENLARDYVKLEQTAAEVAQNELSNRTKDRRRLSSNGDGAQATDIDDAEAILDGAEAEKDSKKKKKKTGWKKFKAAFALGTSKK